MEAQTTGCFYVGRIAPRRKYDPRPCAHGCIGPFERRPDMDEWVADLAREAGIPVEGILPQYDCVTCGTTTGMTPHDLRRAAA